MESEASECDDDATATTVTTVSTTTSTTAASSTVFDDVMEYESEDYILNDVPRDNYQPRTGSEWRTGSIQSGTGSDQLGTGSDPDDVTNKGMTSLENLKKMLAESMNIEIKHSNINIYM